MHGSEQICKHSMKPSFRKALQIDFCPSVEKPVTQGSRAEKFVLSQLKLNQDHETNTRAASHAVRTLPS